HPVTGVGAGAWEVQVPRFQNADMQVEADYYAHNEVLQLLAEYGLTGWLFLCLLIAYLLFATWKTWTDQTQTGRQHAPLRAAALTSLL
ncbi:MAG: O-antigen ligase family protein, partial [Rhodoferax sp.]|nr:O-antigen ligase family protein [Rhodoferax sp.]